VGKRGLGRGTDLPAGTFPLFVIVAGLLCLAPVGIRAQDAAGAGIEYRVERAGLGFVSVHVITLDPRMVELRLLFPPKGEALSFVKSMPGCDTALACFNGSFFQEDSRPIGLLVSEGKRRQRLKTSSSWGVFYVDKERRARVLGRRDFESSMKTSDREIAVQPGDLEFAVQSGPRLLKGGEVVSTHRGLSLRTAIGIDSEGQVYVAVVRVPVSLPFLARFGRDTLHLTDMLNLDGGSSSQLVVHVKDKTADLPGVPVAVGVGLYPRP